MKVTCYSAGIIGASFATYFAMKGCQVTVFNARASSLPRAEGQITQNLNALAAAGCFTSEDVQQILAGIVYTDDLEHALKDAQFIQENGPENLEIKWEIVKNIDSYAPVDCIVASSTSGLRVTDIVKNSFHPERYIGAHPFNPPHLIPLVEITKGEATSQETVDRAVAFYRSIDKEPIVLQKEKIGFVANRLSHAVLREVISLVDEGVCSGEDADRALVYGPGLRWGALGQLMISELGSPGGARDGAVRFKPLNEAIFKDLENRTELPLNWPDVAEAAVAREKAQMSDKIGHTTPEIAAFRDKVLIELLRLHGKL